MKRFNQYNIRQENEYVRAYLQHRLRQGDELYFHPDGKSWVPYQGYYEQVFKVNGGWAMRPVPGAAKEMQQRIERQNATLDAYLEANS